MLKFVLLSFINLNIEMLSKKKSKQKWGVCVIKTSKGIRKMPHDSDGAVALSIMTLKRMDFILTMENLMVIRVEVIAPEKPLISKHLQK
jgi:hypothetical protein